MKARINMAIAVLAIALISACTREAAPPPAQGGEPAKITNRIDVPEVVRSNLGITFAKVERRKIAQTLRVPGRFEYTPAATREHRAALAGRVTLHVKQFDRVEPGALLYSVDSPAWRELQQALNSAWARHVVAQRQTQVRQALLEESTREIELAAGRVEAIQRVMEASNAHMQELESAQELWAQRVKDLEKLVESGTGKVSDLVEARARRSEAVARILEERKARAELDVRKLEIAGEAARMRNALPRLGDEAQAAKAEEQAALADFELKLAQAAGVAGETPEQLGQSADGAERWRSLSLLPVKARARGVVAELAASEGGWVEQGGLVLSTVDPAQVRVRARALQADMSRIMTGQEARILPPAGGALALEVPLEGKVAVGLAGDADERVIDLFVTPQKAFGWARPGVAVEVEITLESSDEPVLAVPVSCVVRDELQRILFRRDPNDADKVIRIAGEFGISDGRWIEVKRDVMEGDEVVLGGVYELKLTGSGKPTGAGHFHADGTWHEGADH